MGTRLGMDEREEIKALLTAWNAGDERALQQLSPFVYDELRRLARGYLRGERDSHTLQATALVHEAFLRLVNVDVSLDNRTHFYALAARMMRRILVDHARNRKASKRGGTKSRITFEEGAVVGTEVNPMILELDDALARMEQFDARLARAIELIYFGGLTYEETAKELSISRTQLVTDLKLAKAWLHNELQ